jgi:hypothetical protein
MTPARIVLVASLLALVTPAVVATTLKTNDTAVPGISDQARKAPSFAAAAKRWVVGPDRTLERGKIVDVSWRETGKRVAHWRAAVELSRHNAAKPRTLS